MPPEAATGLLARLTPEDPDRRRRLKWRLVYPALTVLPLYAATLVAPGVAFGLMLLLAVPTWLYMGVFGEDLRAEEMRANRSVARPSSSVDARTDPEETVPDSRISQEHLVSYATVVAIGCTVGIIAVLTGVLG